MCWHLVPSKVRQPSDISVAKKSQHQHLLLHQHLHQHLQEDTVAAAVAVEDLEIFLRKFTDKREVILASK